MHQLIVLLGNLLAIIVGLPLLIAGIGLIAGPVYVIYSFKQLLTRIHTIHDAYEGALSTLFVPQPASTMYVFDHGWRLNELFVHHLFNTVDHARKRWIASASLARYIASTSPRLLRWLAMPLSWLFTAGVYSASIIQLLTASITAMLFLALHLLFLYVWGLIALSAIATFMAIAALKGLMSGISMHCPSCYAEVRIPYYRCAGCETLHTQLLPSPYGIFSHRCLTCNTRIPTLDIGGRRKLQRLCSHCRHPLPDAIGRGRTRHIALVGGTSAGKTTYITTALQMLTQTFMMQGPCKTTWIDPGQEQRHLSHLALIASGKKVSPTTERVPQALMLQIHRPKTRKPELLYIYDPAGEAFTSTEQLSAQHYYSFTNGIMFIIDATALLTVQHRSQASVGQAAIPARLAIMQIYERLLSTIESSSGVSATQRSTQPLAVVVTKADIYHPEDKPGMSAIRERMQREPGITEAEASHRVVRGFLCSHGLDNLIRDIEAHFASVHYFSCSVQVQPSLSDNPSKVITNHILDPLAWLLAKNGIAIEDTEH
jgi:hypothetical protein